MEIIGLDLHKRETQLCRRQSDGRIVDERIPTSRARFTADVRRAGAGDDPPRGQHRERVGRRAPRAARPHGDRRRPELRADVRDPQPADQDRQARRPRAHAGLRARRLPAGVPALPGAGPRPGRARGAGHAGAHAGPGHHAPQDAGAGARACACRRAPVARWPRAWRRSTSARPRPTLGAELAPLLALLPALNTQIAALDATLAAIALDDPVVARLATAPGVGRGDGGGRRGGARRHHALPVGPRRRGLPGAWCRASPARPTAGTWGRSPRRATRGRAGCWSRRGGGSVRSTRPRDGGAAGVGGRGLRRGAGSGSRRSRVARRLAGVLYAMWRDGVPYDAAKLARAQRGAPRPGPA